MSNYDNWKLDCGDSGKDTCICCERAFNIDDLYEGTDDELCCADCWDNKFTHCNTCDKTCLIDELDELGRCDDCQEEDL